MHHVLLGGTDVYFVGLRGKSGWRGYAASHFVGYGTLNVRDGFVLAIFECCGRRQLFGKHSWLYLFYIIIHS